MSTHIFNRLTECTRVSTVDVNGTFALPSDAFAAADRYRADYPREGYNTMLTVRHDTVSELWRVEGSRAASCD